MSRRTIELGGDGWQMREALGETWRWHVAADLADLVPAGNNVAGAAGEAGAAPGWLPAAVPGSVITDLARAAEVPDPYTERNSRYAEWTGTRSWVFRRLVEVPAFGPSESAVLEFDGIDPSGTVFWDGTAMGRAEGTYRPLRAGVPDRGGPGRHLVAVVIDPVPASQPQVGRTSAVRVHRPRLNEGWDFCPRFPHQGIWRPARLVIADVHVSAAAVRTELDASGDGEVHLCATLDTPAGEPVPFLVTVADPAGLTVAAERGAGSGQVSVRLSVPGPRLWWPRGLGEQTRYAVRLTVGGEPAPVRLWRVGFRRAELVANADADAGARGYTALVNGRRVPLPGWNWVPAQAQYGATDPRKTARLVGLAARSNARLLRVWGGGLIETEEFYDACDAAGLMVWQEFSQSSSGMQSAPATDAGFTALMIDEAETIIPALTHHPSLLIWGGGNELDEDGVPLDERRSPVLAALRDAVQRLDPGRAWLATSPSGPAFHNRLDVIEAAPREQHDVHGPWEHQGLRAQYTLYNAGTSLAHTEFGVEGMTTERSLQRLIGPGHRWPADRANPVYRHLGEWWNNTGLVQASFRGRLAGLTALRRASQLLQAAGLGYAVEADRRRWPRCSMVLPWQLSESYPNAWCTSCVDYAGVPKPAYHAVTRAFAPRRVTVRVPTAVWEGEPELTAQAWVWAEPQVPPGSRVIIRLRSADNEVLAERGFGIAEAVDLPRHAGTATIPAGAVRPDAVVVWDVTWQAADGTLLDRELMLACTGNDFAPLLDLAQTQVAATARTDGDLVAVEVAHLRGPMAVGLELLDDRPATEPGVLVCDGDPRPLLPGERRRFRVRAEPAGTPVRLRAEAWNIAPIRLTAAGAMPGEITGRHHPDAEWNRS